MTKTISADSLHRLVKQAIDSGAANSIHEAQALFLGFKLAIVFNPDDVRNPVAQATLLTTVALAKRVFLGGVTISGTLGAPVTIRLPVGPTNLEATDTTGHPNADNLRLLVIRGPSLMTLVHALYERAASEA